MNSERFIDFIECWCLNNNTNMKQLLLSANIEPTYITQIKNKRNKNPLTLNIYKLCKAMNVSMESFMEEIYDL